ncbi:lysylphosphatidylglycerol synthase domain-containing protein [Ferruginibacter albus]|uniref:lysylphosphatidylglycerol synthase domain-containing protein n=1 Tax=Ferruginibacter albus TaxID=2875540 RepID=UPI001CC5DAA7|nr:lysylphosphatidylglycerol synthase domain-containing protein [Ferruginibacter albus]UAY51795.1 lysylphosphatidylglycerol synthase domain-containing protein [Ferruginibacter albus]
MNKQIKILLNYFLGPVLFVLLSWSLYKQIINQPDLANRWEEIKASWYNYKFWLVIILMLVNWGIEARKWQLLIGHLQQFSFFKAFSAVLSGSSVTMLTPNRVGEYGGRILYVEEGNRIKAISLTIVGSISQFLVTMVMGCCGLFFLRFFSTRANALNELPSLWSNILLSLSIALTLLILLFYLRIGWLVRMIEKITALQKFVKHIQVLDEFSNMQLLHILLLSFVRYMVFVLQYVLLLQVMQVDIGIILGCTSINVFYLVMAIVPTFGFIEFPMRAKTSWEILKFYTTNELGVGAATLGIWLINLVVPAIIGSLLILSIKIIKEK